MHMWEIRLRASVVAIALAACLLAGCTKSPVDTAVYSLQAASAKLMDNLVEKTASRQAEGLARLIYNRTDCQPYIDRLREAGRGAPANGATQWALEHTYVDAQKAGCVKED